MIFGVEFHPDALKEFNSLEKNIREIFVKKLSKRMSEPFVLSAKLSGDLSDCFKIKDKKSGIRLIYTVDVTSKIIYVIAVGKREKNSAYQNARKRID